MEIQLRPLLLGYLAWKLSDVKKEDFFSDIETIVNKLDSKGITVYLDSNEEIEVLISFWEDKKYIEKDGDLIRISDSRKNFFNKEFVLNRLFDKRSMIFDKIVSIYEEVLGNEDKNSSGFCAWVR